MKDTTLRHSYNLISGVFVLVMSFIAYAMSDISESVERNNDYRHFLWIFVWFIGFALQFKCSLRVIGLIITVIPFFYYLITLILVF